MRFTGSAKSPEHFEDYKLAWRPFIEQKVPLICYKAGSDEIVGVNMIFVLHKDDDYLKKIYQHVSYKFLTF